MTANRNSQIPNLSVQQWAHSVRAEIIANESRYRSMLSTSEIPTPNCLKPSKEWGEGCSLSRKMNPTFSKSAWESSIDFSGFISGPKYTHAIMCVPWWSWGKAWLICLTLARTHLGTYFFDHRGLMACQTAKLTQLLTVSSAIINISIQT